jgi:hypothetical protein
MKCQALASELGKLRAEIATMRRGGEGADLARVNILLRGVDELEKALTETMGSPEQRALEAAESQLEAGIREHLIHLSLLRLSPLNHREQAEVEGELEVLRRRVVALRPAASPYTSEAEEKLVRIKQLLAHSDNLIHPFVTELRQILGDA